MPDKSLISYILNKYFILIAYLNVNLLKYLVVGSDQQSEGFLIHRRVLERSSNAEAKGRSKPCTEEIVYRYSRKKGHIKAEFFKLQNKEKIIDNQKEK